MGRLLFSAILLILLGVVDSQIKVDPKSRAYVDPAGRIRFFHGVNVVYKVPPYVPPQDGPFDPLVSMVDEDLENLKEWGFTVVRLGVMWPGTEPEQGVYNQTYLKAMQQLVGRLGERGIYSIIDVHQDLYSPFFCGEGAPDWAVHHDNSTPGFPFPIPKTLPIDPATGYPMTNSCLSSVANFGEFYIAEATGQAFQDLYENTAKIQDAFLAMWKQLASTFNTYPYGQWVLGYEFLNEPFAGNIERHPSLLLPGETDRKYLRSFYSRLHETIRSVDDQHIVFFEPMVANIGHVGFTEGPGGPEYDDRQVLSYHVYCVDTDKHGDPRSMLVCNMTDEWFFLLRYEDTKAIGVPGFLTEFGSNYESETAVDSMHFVTGEAEKYGQSWTYWQFKAFGDITTSGGSLESFYDADGSLQVPKVKALSRTYAPAVAGRDVFSTFDPNTATLMLQYKTVELKAFTEIYLNEALNYPNGFDVTITPAAAATWERQPGEAMNRLVIHPAKETPTGTQLTVKIAPKA